VKRRRGLAAAVGAAPSGMVSDAGAEGPAARASRSGGAAVEAPAVRTADDSTQQFAREGSSTSDGQLTMAELSERLRATIGHSLRVAPSALRHSGAGDGLWLTGAAQTGAVVALYPGVVYMALHHRCGHAHVKYSALISFVSQLWGSLRQLSHTLQKPVSPVTPCVLLAAGRRVHLHYHTSVRS